MKGNWQVAGAMVVRGGGRRAAGCEAGLRRKVKVAGGEVCAAGGGL